MGEAKARLAELRTRMIVELERWMTPTSAEEDRLNDAIRALTFYKIQRVPDDQLTYMKMEPQQCHLNASAYAKLDPTGESQHVSGWWKRGGIFFFHSVILTRTRLSCVTPHHDPSPLQFAQVLQCFQNLGYRTLASSLRTRSIKSRTAWAGCLPLSSIAWMREARSPTSATR